MKLLFIRHGLTDFNQQGRPQGSEIDEPLNAIGITQVEEAVKSVPGDIDFIIASPLKRASQTADILNKTLNKKIEFNDDIKEMRFGTLAGKTWEDIVVETGDADIRHKHHSMQFDYRNYGGESIEDFKQRIIKFVNEIKEKYSDKKILVATHGGVINVMHALYPQKEKQDVKNATIHEFDF